MNVAVRYDVNSHACGVNRREQRVLGGRISHTPKKTGKAGRPGRGKTEGPFFVGIRCFLFVCVPSVCVPLAVHVVVCVLTVS